jgi:hypothetical protein
MGTDRALSAILVVSVAVALMGCGSNGTPAGDGGQSADSLAQLTSLDDPCGPSKLTGKQLLTRVASPYSTVLGPPPNKTGATTPLTIDVAYNGGPIRCEPPFEPPPGSNAPSRPEVLHVEVTIIFKSEDGAFDETFDTEVSGFPEGTGVDFSHAIAADQLKGSFDPELSGYQKVTVSISGSFSGADTRGQIGKGGTKPGQAPTAFPSVLRWPAS